MTEVIQVMGGRELGLFCCYDLWNDIVLFESRLELVGNSMLQTLGQPLKKLKGNAMLRKKGGKNRVT